MDEAASRLRIEIDSMPQEIDEVERRIMQLEIERTALQKEKDASAVARRKNLERELSELRERSQAMKAQWQQEKDTLGAVGKIKQQIDQAKVEAEQATRTGDLNKAAEITYGRIPKLQQQLQEAERKLASRDGGGAGRPQFLKEEVTADDIAEIVARWTGIPVSRMMESERARLTKLDQELAQRVIGQDEAVRAVANAVRRSRAGLQDPNRPIGSFIFLGPTGVGKTETARALADFLFDDEHAMVRIDMSEYSEKHSVARLVGAPPGYVGYEEGGQLTEAVRRRPYSVVLLDEVEKAHPEIFDVLLQVLDDGRLTDGQGRTVDFRNTILILTSNLGTAGFDLTVDEALDPVQARLDRRQRVDSAVRAAFKPEFLNRLDAQVVFDPLGTTELGRIVGIQVGKLAKRLADRRLLLEVTPGASDWLAIAGYEPAFGARPLRRLVQSAIGDPLARKLLAGEIRDGDTVRVDVDVENDALVITSQSPQSAQPPQA